MSSEHHEGRIARDILGLSFPPLFLPHSRGDLFAAGLPAGNQGLSQHSKYLQGLDISQEERYQPRPALSGVDIGLPLRVSGESVSH